MKTRNDSEARWSGESVTPAQWQAKHIRDANDEMFDLAMGYAYEAGYHDGKDAQ